MTGRGEANPRVDDFQRRHRWFALPIAVVYKFFDDQGSYLVALLAYYGFVSLFPLLLVAVTILGFVLHGDHALQQSIISSALNQFPIVGPEIRGDIKGYTGSDTGLAVGLLISLYGALGVGQAGQNAMNQVYAVPRNERPNPFKARGISLSMIGIVVLAASAIYGVTWVSSHLPDGWHGTSVRYAGSTLVYFVLFVVVFRLLTARPVRLRDVVVGALLAAVAWVALQRGGSAYVDHQLRGHNDVYGTFSVVLGLLAWIYLLALVVVLSAELNVVVRRHLWPRALLTPFTDDVNLTPADERSYTAYAQAQRHKGFERVDVDFEGDASAPPATDPAAGRSWGRGKRRRPRTPSARWRRRSGRR